MKHRYSTKLMEAIRTTATASKYISHVNNLKPGSGAVLYVRESTETQRKNSPHQRSNLEWEVERRGISVIAVFGEIAPSGDGVTSGFIGRIGFERAVLKAKESGAVVIAESVDRYKRNQAYHSSRYLPLKVLDMESLMLDAEGVQLATVVHPDASPAEVRSYQSQRGQAGKRHYGGRPVEQFPKKARRLRLEQKAKALRKKGFSYQSISRELKVPRSTIRDWTEYEKTAHRLGRGNSR